MGRGAAVGVAVGLICIIAHDFLIWRCMHNLRRLVVCAVLVLVVAVQMSVSFFLFVCFLACSCRWLAHWVSLVLPFGCAGVGYVGWWRGAKWMLVVDFPICRSPL